MINQVKNSMFFKELTAKGKVYFVGGCVRDFFLNIPSKDVDLLVSGIEIEKLKTILNPFGDFNLVGASFSVIKFKPFELNLKEPIDIALPRKEIKIGEKRTDFKIISDPTMTIEDDLIRRDFTINSFALDANLNIIDPFNGLEDLKKGIVRMTNEEHFFEDELRFLRAVRFAARFDFHIEENTFNAIINNCKALNKISKERIQDEFMKILGGKNPIKGIELLMDTHLIDSFFPEIHTCVGVEQNKFHSNDVLGHIFDVINNIKPTAIHRLTALLHDIAKPECKTITETGIHFFEHHIKSMDVAKRVMTELKFSNEDIDLVTTTVRNHMIFMDEKSRNPRVVRRWRMKLGEEKFNFLLDLMEADVKSSTDKRNWVDNLRHMQITEKPILILPIDGNDIMTLFNIKPGPRVKELKDAVIEMVCENPDITKDEVIEKLKAL